jgi:hypothetical protein
MISALIVDEAGSDGPVRQELTRTQPTLLVRGTVRSLREAIRHVETSPPDYVYLRWEAAADLRPEALNFLTLRTRLVFVTAYGSHLIHSVQSGPEPRPDAGARLSPQSGMSRADSPEISALPDTSETAKSSAATAASTLAARPVNVPGHTEMISLEDILWIEAAQNYSKVYRRNSGHDLLYHRTMSAWESALPDAHFRRLSRSVIIGLSSMRSLASCGRNGACVSFAGSAKQLRLGRAPASRLKSWIRCGTARRGED